MMLENNLKSTGYQPVR